MDKTFLVTEDSALSKESIRKLSKETQQLIDKYGYLPSTRAKVRSDRNDSSWFRKTFQRPKR